MPVRIDVSLRTATSATCQIKAIADKARLQLEDVISCITVAVDSTNQALLLDYAKEYQRCLNGMIRLMEKSVPVSGDVGPPAKT
mgnify:FL=1